MKRYEHALFSPVTALVLLVCFLIITALFCRSTEAAVLIDPHPNAKAVIIEMSDINTEHCILIIRRSQIVQRSPRARCATKAELQEVLK